MWFLTNICPNNSGSRVQVRSLCGSKQTDPKNYPKSENNIDIDDEIRPVIAGDDYENDDDVCVLGWGFYCKNSKNPKFRVRFWSWSIKKGKLWSLSQHQRRNQLECSSYKIWHSMRFTWLRYSTTNLESFSTILFKMYHIVLKKCLTITSRILNRFQIYSRAFEDKLSKVVKIHFD